MNPTAFTPAAPRYVTQAQYARHRGVDPAHITRLKQNGRLVMDDTGKRVDVIASDALLDASASGLPHHQAAADHHAAGRRRPETPSEPSDDLEGPHADEDLKAAGLRLKRAQATRAEADAELAVMERDQAAGRLVDVSAARDLIGGAVITLRSNLEAWPDRLAGLLVGKDASQIHSLLADEIERELTVLSSRIGAMGENA